MVPEALHIFYRGPLCRLDGSPLATILAASRASSELELYAGGFPWPSIMAFNLPIPRPPRTPSPPSDEAPESSRAPSPAPSYDSKSLNPVEEDTPADPGRLSPSHLLMRPASHESLSPIPTGSRERSVSPASRSASPGPFNFSTTVLSKGPILKSVSKPASTTQDIMIANLGM